MSSPWKPPFANTTKGLGKNLFRLNLQCLENQKKISYQHSLEKFETNRRLALFAKGAKIEDKINRCFKALEDSTQKLDALRSAVVELRKEVIPGLTQELEEVNTKIGAGEKKMKVELEAYLDEEIKKAFEKNMLEMLIQQKLAFS